MPIEFVCPSCERKLLSPDQLAGFRIECPTCKYRGVVPAKTIPAKLILAKTPAATPRSAGSATSLPRRPGQFSPPRVGLVLLASLAWLAVGGALAQASPYLLLYVGPVEALLGCVAIVITGGFILWNAWISLRIISSTGQTRWALPLTGMQLVLFTLFFAQLAAHSGSAHFEMSRAPQVWDWLTFSCAQAFRAADVIDTLQAYGLRVQMIRPASELAGWSVAIFRLLIDLFILRVLFDAFDRFKGRVAGSVDSRWLLRGIVAGVGLFIIVWLVSALFVRPWRTADLFLWPVENFARVFDFPDLMDVYDVRLSQVPHVAWEGTLTIIFRIFAALLLAELGERISTAIHVYLLRGVGLTRDALQELVRRGRPELKAIALARLAEIAETRPVTLAELRRAWTADGHTLIAACTAAAGAGVLLLSALLNPAPRLVEHVGQAETGRESRALVGLSRLGISAAAHADTLADRAAQVPPPRRAAIVSTLGSLGAQAGEPLARFVNDPDDAVALATVEALARIGSDRAPALADLGLSSPRETVRTAAREFLLRLGERGVQPLIDSLTHENAAARIPLLAQLDVYWDLRSSANPVYAEIAPNHRAIRVLDDPGSSPERVQAAALELAGRGATAVPLIWTRLLSAGEPLRGYLSDVLVGMKADAAGLLARRLADGSDVEWPVATLILERIGGLAAPALVQSLLHADDAALVRCLELLRKFGPEAAPALADGLSLPEKARQGVVQLLVELGPAAATAVAPHLASNATRALADLTLRRLDPRAMPALRPFLADASLDVRQAVREIVADTSPDELRMAAESYVSRALVAARERITAKEHAAAGDILATIPPSLRRWEWEHLAGLAERKSFEISQLTEDHSHMLLSADSSQAVFPLLAPPAAWNLVTGQKEPPRLWLNSRDRISARGIERRTAGGLANPFDVFSGDAAFRDPLYLQDVLRTEVSAHGLYVLYDGGGVRVVDARTGQNLVSPEEGCTLGRFLPSGNQVAISGARTTVFELPLGTEVKSIERGATCLAVHPSDGSLVTAASGKMTWLDTELNVTREIDLPRTTSTGGSDCQVLEFCPLGRRIVALQDFERDNLGAVVLVEAATVEILTTYRPNQPPPGFLAEFSPDGRLLAVVAESKSVLVWLAETGELLTRWDFPADYPYFGFTPDSRQLVVRAGARLYSAPGAVTTSAAFQASRSNAVAASFPDILTDISTVLATRLGSDSEPLRRAAGDALAGLGPAVIGTLFKAHVAANDSGRAEIERVLAILAERHGSEFIAEGVTRGGSSLNLAQRALARVPPAARARLLANAAGWPAASLAVVGELIHDLPDPPLAELEALAAGWDERLRTWAAGILAKTPGPRTMDAFALLAEASRASREGNEGRAHDLAALCDSQGLGWGGRYLAARLNVNKPILLGPDEHEMHRLQASPDGRFLAASCEMEVRVWWLESGQLALVVPALPTEELAKSRPFKNEEGQTLLFNPPALDVTFSPDGTRLALATSSSLTIGEVPFSLSDRQLAVVNHDIVRVFSLPTSVAGTDSKDSAPRSNKPKARVLNMNKFTLEDWYHASLWDPATGRLLRKLSPPEPLHLAAPTWSPDGKQIALSADLNRLLLFSADSGDHQRTVSLENTRGAGYLPRVTLLPDDCLVVDNILYAIGDGKVLARVNGWTHAASLPFLVGSVASNEPGVRVETMFISTKDGQTANRWLGGGDSLAVSPDGMWLATHGFQESFWTLWHVPSGQELAKVPLAEQYPRIEAMFFTSDGERLVIQRDRTIEIHSTEIHSTAGVQIR